MSATRNVLAAFVTLTAATASAATGAIDPSVAIPSVRPSLVIPSSAFTAAFIGSVADDQGGAQVNYAHYESMPYPKTPPRYLKIIPPTPQSRPAGPVRLAPVPIPHVR
jgi:hypothetical protein